jgi:hypothetical protein
MIFFVNQWKEYLSDDMCTLLTIKAAQNCYGHIISHASVVTASNEDQFVEDQSVSFNKMLHSHSFAFFLNLATVRHTLKPALY